MRTWVSLVLFIHLFAVFVAVTTYTRPSGLQEQLHALFSPYLRNLHLAAYPVTYPFARYHLTHATGADLDFTCEVEIEGAGGSREQVTIPQRGIQPAVRFRRYQAIANATGTLAQPEGNDELAGVLPKAIAGSILKQHGATQGAFRLRGHGLPDIESIDTAAAARPGALDRDVYEAQVFVSGGRTELLKKSATLEVAPVEGKTKPSGKTKGPSGPKP